MRQLIITFPLLLGIIVSVASCTSTPPKVTPSLLTQADQLMVQGLTQFERGEFVQAVQNWQQAAELYQQSGQMDLSINALLRLSEAYQRLGHYPTALAVLEEKALTQAETASDQGQIAAVRGSLGQLYFLMGEMKKAQGHLDKSIQLARQTQQPALQALGLLHLGHVLAAQQDYPAAQSHLTQSIQLAQQHNQPRLAIKGLMNQVWIWLEMGDKRSAQTQLTALWPQLQQLPDSHEKAYLLLKFHQFAQQLGGQFTPDLRLILKATIATAKAINDQYALSQALGELGYLDEQAQQYQIALENTHQARLAARQINAPRLLYRWEWQAGRLFNAQGEIEKAIVAYQSAKYVVDQLKQVPQDSTSESCQTAARSPDFKTVIEPLFLGLADLLLQRSKTLLDENDRQQEMRKARDVVESLKKQEIQDYFESACATQVLGKARQIDHIGEKTAVIYPIVFENRLELLLSLPNGDIKQVTQDAVTKEQVKNTVDRLRGELEEKKDNYLGPAQQLYRWLIKPIVPTFDKHNIDTLVVVPRDALLTVPFAAFHDGKNFLMEQYALAITTGVALTAPTQNLLADEAIPVLSSGLTKVTPEIEKECDALRIKGCSLRLAGWELEQMQNFYSKKHRQLKGEEFTIKQLDKALETPYTLLHITSHAHFSPDFEKTFIITYDDKLTMDQLEKLVKKSKYRKEPLELLTLNACETAKGDERAALGLSGIALKAGARSALATLWIAWDDSASHLTLNFYQHLKQSQLSKAQALQEAQKSLLDSQFKHPHYWSPFLLIGNWL